MPLGTLSYVSSSQAELRRICWLFTNSFPCGNVLTSTYFCHTLGDMERGPEKPLGREWGRGSVVPWGRHKNVKGMERAKPTVPELGGRNPAPRCGYAANLWQVPPITEPHIPHPKNGLGCLKFFLGASWLCSYFSRCSHNGNWVYPQSLSTARQWRTVTRSMGFGGWRTRVRVQVQMVIHCVTLGKSLSLSEPQCSHL